MTMKPSVGHYTGRWQRSVIVFFEKYAPRWAHLVTTNTDHTRQRLALMGTPLEKIHYISNGIDRQRFAPVDSVTTEALRKRWGLENRRVIAYIGTLSRPSHPVELLFQAFERIRAEISFCPADAGRRRR
jgi:glycosyltransferase involved in cell wall biosynthesis